MERMYNFKIPKGAKELDLMSFINRAKKLGFTDCIYYYHNYEKDTCYLISSIGLWIEKRKYYDYNLPMVKTNLKQDKLLIELQEEIRKIRKDKIDKICSR